MDGSPGAGRSVCQPASKTDPPSASIPDPAGIGEMSPRLPLKALLRRSAIAASGSRPHADYPQKWVIIARRLTTTAVGALLGISDPTCMDIWRDRDTKPSALVEM